MEALSIIIFVLTFALGLILGTPLGGSGFNLLVIIYIWISGGLLGTIFLGFALLLDRHNKLMHKIFELEKKLQNTQQQTPAMSKLQPLASSKSNQITRRTCSRCGVPLNNQYIECPNCGAKL